MKPTKQRPASATAYAGRAVRDAATRPPAAPLPRVRVAVGGPHQGVVKKTAEPASDGSPASRHQEHRAMSGHDAELALFLRSVNCAVLLESAVPGWKLDPKESTRRAQIPPRRRRDPDHQPRWARLVGPGGRCQGRRVRPRAAPRPASELRSGPPAPASLRGSSAKLSHGVAGKEGEGP